MSYLIIDGNSIGYAAHSTKPLVVDGIGEVQAVYQSLKMLKSLKQKYSEYPNILWLWDGKADFRFELYPEYKGNRSDTAEKREVKEKYHAVEDYLRKCLSLLGVVQLIAPNYEADDLAAFYCRQATKKNRKVQLITGDGDWKQLVSKNVSWCDPRTKLERFVDHTNFSQETGFDTPGKFLMHKALMGDSSDNIPSVGIGDKGAKLLIDHFGGVKQMLQAYKKDGEFNKSNLPGDEFKFHRKRYNEFCKSGVGLFKRNYELMNLLTDKRDLDILNTVKASRSPTNIEEFEYVCRELRFMSIVREISRWEKLFNR